MLQKVREYIKQYNMIREGDEIIAGVSGGADSVCMLLNLVEFSKEVNCTIKVVHINHMIRKEASEDARFVEDLCESLGLEFCLYEEGVEKLAKKWGLSTEEAGRKIRYDRFAESADRVTYKIAVAHNANDVAETVLFNIFRGTGLEGLSSLEPVNGNIIRPLLCLTRNEIEDYLKSVNQRYVTDATNATESYSRNKIRNRILPYAESEIVKGATEHITHMSEKMRLIKQHLKAETEAAESKTVIYHENGAELMIDELRSLDELMRQEVVLLVLEKLTKGRKDIGEIHVLSILGLIDKSGTHRVDLPYNLEASKQYDRLYIRKKRTENKEYEDIVLIPGEDVDAGNGLSIKTRIFDYDSQSEIPQKAYTKWFDYDKIISCVILRRRREGDYLTVDSRMSQKSLKEYMINTKIPKDERSLVPLLADNSHIIWVIGYRISEYYKVTTETKRIIEVTVERT